MGERMMKFFAWDHLPAGGERDVVAMFHALAEAVCAVLPAGPERTVSLRKLVESMDAALRAYKWERSVGGDLAVLVGRTGQVLAERLKSNDIVDDQGKPDHPACRD